MRKRISRDPGADIPRRTLIYIPIIHTRADMGALNESISRTTLRKTGRGAFKRKVNVVDRLWTKIEKAIDNLQLPYEKVRIYQDGLPVCGREVEIVTELARAGSRNHLLVERLMERGATIMGTESGELIVEEYELIKKILSAGDAKEAAKIEASQRAVSDRLLKRRDHYIAHRINSTLHMDERGILFLGMLHSLTGLLDKDIRIMYPTSPPI
jgi:hypothetical protein